MKKLLFLLIALSAGAQVPAPQLNLTGNIGCIGFPCLNSGTYQMPSDANVTFAGTSPNTSAISIKITSAVTLTATRTITYPAGNFYLNVENATTGGQSITIIGPSGTGKTIPNGQSLSVWNDGAGFVCVGGITLGSTTIPCGTPTSTVAGLNSLSWGTGQTLITSGSVYLDLLSNPNAGLNLTGNSTYGTHFIVTDRYLGNSWYQGVEGTNQSNFIGSYCITHDGTWQLCDLEVFNGGIAPAHLYSQLNCAYVGNPAVCGGQTNGSSLILAGSTSEVIQTTAVNVGSQILITTDTTLGARFPGGTVTCNATAGQGTASVYVSSRTPGVGFTITTTAGSISTNPACVSWMIVN